MAFLTLTEPIAEAIPTNSVELARVLVIDDDPVNRELMRRLFEPDYSVMCAGSGQAGLDLLASEAVDVVLLDIMMPVMNGFEVLERIRRDEATADLPVILVSGLTDNESVVRGLRLGANDYVTKPINIHVARARISSQVKTKRLLDEHKRVIAQLEQLNRLREHFFRMASHDLKNPLTNLRLANYELRNFVDNPDAEFAHTAIESSVDSMQALIEDLLDVAALHGGKLDVSANCVSLEACIQRVMCDYNAAAAAKNIRIVVGDVRGLVIADSKRLAQAIGNLVSNAIKFSPANSTVNVWAQYCGKNMRVYVRDQGPGLEPEDQALLFQEFARGSARPTGGETSHGLGLWIVKQLVTLMGGTVGVESLPGRGASFWVELPAIDLHAA